MKYTLQHLADHIQGMIEFTEPEKEQIRLDDEIKFDDYLATFLIYADGYQNYNAESFLTDLYIECVVLIDNDNEHRELSRDELVKLENLISW